MIRFHPTYGARDALPMGVSECGASQRVGTPRSVAWRAGCCSGERGFTLVELMVTVAVAAILMAIAVPSFRSIMISNKLTTSANEIVDAINAARMAAIKRNANAQLCSDLASANTSDTLGSACNTTVQPAAVYVLVTTSSGPAPAPVRAAETSITTPIQLKGNITAVRFGGDGLARVIGSTAPYGGPIADICSSAISTDNHRVITMAAGSIIETDTTTGACP